VTEAESTSLAVEEREAELASLSAWGCEASRRKRLCAALAASLAIHAPVFWAPTSVAKIFAAAESEDNRVLRVSLVHKKPTPDAASVGLNRVVEPQLPAPSPAKPRESSRESPPECPAPHHYYRIRDVEQPPMPISGIDRNPVELLRHPNAGTLQADLCIDPTGAVSKVIVIASDLPPIFATSAIRHFSTVRFKPALLNRQAVAVRQRISVRYAPPVGNPLAEKVAE
jgi:hypothetical protein